uniref:Ig-like domain-containing protein n=1 Tax=Globodera rostochiensis TaxID=31243 RepID=A0A914I024_GLORO
MSGGWDWHLQKSHFASNKIAILPCFTSMNCFTTVLIANFAMLVAMAPTTAQGKQRIVEEPEDTVARVGDTVLLRCRVADQKGQVIWMQGDIGLGYKRDLPFWERMRMVGSLNDGEFHLEIRNVSLADEQTYQCQLSSSEDEPIAQLSRRATLTLLSEPKMPQLLGESVGTGAVSSTVQRTQPIVATEGHAIRLSCQSRVGKPAARLSWALAEDWHAQKVIGHIANWTAENATDQTTTTGHPIRVREHLRQPPAHHIFRPIFGNISEELVKDWDTQLNTITSHLNFTPTQADNGRWLVCLAAHEVYGKESRSASIRLDVLFAPKVRVETIPEGSQIYEGGYIRLHCASDAHPDDVKLRWSWDGEPKRLEVVDAQTVLINGLRFNDNGRRVTCTAENTIGVGTGVFELDVPSGPRFMSTNQSKVVERGGQASFQCEVLGNPTPIVRWYHGRDMDIPIEEGKNITITDVLDWKEGEYRCVAEVDGFPPKALHHMLFLKGPPKVQLSEQFLFDADSVTLACKVQHRSERVKVHWYHNGHRVDIEPGVHLQQQPELDGVGDHQPHYAVRDERMSRWEIVSRLTILRFTDADFGTYNCTARNEHGVVSDQREITLNVVDSLRWFVNKTPMEARIGVGLFTLALLGIACMACCCCIRNWNRRRCGLSKFSKANGDFTVNVEEVDNGTNTSSSAPLCDQQFYTPDFHFTNYSPNNGFIPHNQHQQYGGDQFILMPNGAGGVTATDPQSDVHQQTFCSSYQSFGNGVGSTFGHKTVNNNNNNMLPVLSPNSFDGMMALDGTTTTVPGTMPFSNRSSPQYYQQQQQYGVMETVPEEMLRTPDSTASDNRTYLSNGGNVLMPMGRGGEQQQQRTFSQVSSFLPINAFILFVCDVWKKVKDKFGTLNGLLLCHGIDHKQLCGYLKAGKCPFWHIQNIL